MIYTEASMRLLDDIGDARRVPESETTFSMSPTLVKIADPVRDMEDLIAPLLPGMTERTRSSWLDKRRGRQKLPERICCMAMAEELDARLVHLAVPSQHVCPGCGTRWSVQHRAREERRHG